MVDLSPLILDGVRISPLSDWCQTLHILLKLNGTSIGISRQEKLSDTEQVFSINEPFRQYTSNAKYVLLRRIQVANIALGVCCFTGFDVCWYLKTKMLCVLESVFHEGSIHAHSLSITMFPALRTHSNIFFDASLKPMKKKYGKFVKLRYILKGSVPIYL